MAKQYGIAPKSRAPAEESGMAEPETDGAPDLTESPEFEMALAKASADIYEKVLAQVRAESASGKPASANSDDSEIMRLARAIAVSNAEMADQGNYRRRVAPEVMEARRRSRAEMEHLLAEAQSLPKDKRPLYRVRAKGYFGDRLIEPYQRLAGGVIAPVHVTFMSSPNFALEPANDAAKAIYAAFLGSVAGGESSIGGYHVPDPSAVKPMWVTQTGVVISPTRNNVTAMMHGRIMDADALSVDYPERGVPPVGGIQAEIVDPHDPRATKIPVLGTIAPPAVRGSTSTRLA